MAVAPPFAALPAAPVPLLAAEVQTDVLLRSLLIALVVVSPFAYRLFRKVQARRAAEAEANRPSEPVVTGPVRPRLEDVISAIDALGRSGHADGSPATAPPRTVVVPADVTVDGQDPPEGLVDLLVRDALRRSGLVATAEVDTPDGRVIECAPAPGGAGPGA
jgi:hypothetical protein